MSTWTPKLPGNASDSFNDWMLADDSHVRNISSKCECGVDVTYASMSEEVRGYWHSHWCPKYKEKPKKDQE